MQPVVRVIARVRVTKREFSGIIGDATAKNEVLVLNARWSGNSRKEAALAAGYLLALRSGADASYWTEILPAFLVIAVGFSTVDARDTGPASGFNSAVARTGGLVATALLGPVLAARGGALLHAFHLAMLASAVACVAASADF